MTRRHQRSFQPAVFLTKMGAKSIIALFREGQAICSQGDAGREVFYIEKGQVKLTVKSKRGKETVLAILHRGDYLGAGCMTGQAFRTATATAVTRCRVLVIEKKEMTRALHNGHEFSDHFMACLLGRNIRVEEDLIDQHLCSCEERLARALLLIARYDKIRKPTAVIPKISQKTLGGLIKKPQLAKGDQIIAIPTLVRRLPPPVKKIIGSLSKTESVMVGLDLSTDTLKYGLK